MQMRCFLHHDPRLNFNSTYSGAKIMCLNEEEREQSREENF
jgi:hypothetical protein